MGVVREHFTKTRDKFKNSLNLHTVDSLHTSDSLLTETKLDNYLEQRGSHTLVDLIEQKWFEIIKAKK